MTKPFDPIRSGDSVRADQPIDIDALFDDRWDRTSDADAIFDRTLPLDQSTLPARIEASEPRKFLKGDLTGARPDAEGSLTQLRQEVAAVDDLVADSDPATSIGNDWTSLTRPPSFEERDRASSPGFDPRLRRSRIGRFALLERLGVGGFGEVWKAYDSRLQREVALKIGLFGESDSEQVSLLLHEARAAGQLQHPYLVQVHEAAVEDGIAYIVSDFISGSTLANRLKSESIGLRKCAEIVWKLSVAVAHAHDRGVIHRDIKPANVLLDDAGDPHLIDFGVARRLAGDRTISHEGEALGTPAYMAPEQARGELATADHRADVYSIGILLFEMIAGQRAYRGDARKALQRVLLGPPQRLRLFRHDLPRDLETIVEIAIARDPNEHYPTASELADDLERFLLGEPIVGRRVDLVHRCWRKIRRNVVPAAIGSLLILLAGWPWAVGYTLGFDVFKSQEDSNASTRGTPAPSENLESP